MPYLETNEETELLLPVIRLRLLQGIASSSKAR